MERGVWGMGGPYSTDVTVHPLHRQGFLQTRQPSTWHLFFRSVCLPDFDRGSTGPAVSRLVTVPCGSLQTVGGRVEGNLGRPHVPLLGTLHENPETPPTPNPPSPLTRPCLLK